MNGRSIQDIVPPARNRPQRPSVQPEPREPIHSPPHMKLEPSNSWMFVWVAVGALLLVSAIVTVMTLFFHTATAKVVVMEWKSDVSGSYTAGDTNPLTYDLVKVSEKSSKTVPATGTAQAEDRASGTIIVSNLYSAKAQRLITNTRFESTDGKVYRIHAPISVPGFTMKGGEKVPGTIEAPVYADQPGDTYNTESATFVLPGLKGSDQYSKITATTKTPLSGGFIGTRATVEKSVRDQAVSEIKADLERTLRERVQANAPQGAVIFTDSVAITYTENPDVGTGSDATITIDGSAVAPAFQGDALARELATRASISSDAPLVLMNPDEASYTGGVLDGLAAGGVFSFTLSGTAHLRAVFNPLEFAQALVGKTEEDAQAVRSQFQSLTGPLGLEVRPFWLSSLPKNPERITVDVVGALDQ